MHNLSMIDIIINMLIVFLTDGTDFTWAMLSIATLSAVLMITSEKQQLHKVSHHMKLRPCQQIHCCIVSTVVAKTNRSKSAPLNPKHVASLMTCICIHSNIKHLNSKLAPSWCTRGFIPSPPKQKPHSQSKVLKMIYSAHPLVASQPIFLCGIKSLILPSRAGWHRNNRVRLPLLCCSRWICGWIAARRMKRGEEGLRSCPHALVDAKEEEDVSL